MLGSGLGVGEIAISQVIYEQVEVGDVILGHFTKLDSYQNLCRIQTRVVLGQPLVYKADAGITSYFWLRL